MQTTAGIFALILGLSFVRAFFYAYESLMEKKYGTFLVVLLFMCPWGPILVLNGVALIFDIPGLFTVLDIPDCGKTGCRPYDY